MGDYMKKIIVFLILLIPFNIKAFESDGQCTMLMEMSNNRILFAENMHTIRSVASISKIMTAILAIESDKINNQIIIGEEIEGSYGSGIYIKQNEELKIIDLVYGLMLRSGNDAANAIAYHISGNNDDFVKLMNQKAKEIGMINTTFNNSSGLDTPKSNYSTAYDMAVLTSYAMKNELYRKVVFTKKYSLKTNMNTYIWHNKNKLLNSYKYTTGGKTGFTEIAKRTLVTTASKNDLDLVAVTLNDGNDFLDHKKLYEEAFNIYTNYKIIKKGNINIINEKYYPNYDFYVKNSFSYPLTNLETDNIILKFEIEQKKEIKSNNKIGQLIIKLGDLEIYRDDIYIKEKSLEKSIFIKISNWLKKIW